MYVEVRKSKISGNGVFATKSIPSRTIVTYFSQDLIELNENFKYTYIGNCQLKNENCYRIQISDTKSIVGDKNNIKDPMNIGHIINDVYAPKSFEECYKYKENTLLTNCQFLFIDDKVAIITTREILENEELTISYGVDYWRQRLIDNKYKRI